MGEGRVVGTALALLQHILGASGSQGLWGQDLPSA